jgi:uncharacterized protein (TIRG00374 family)
VRRRHVFLALNLVLGLGGLGWMLRHFGHDALSLLSGRHSPGLLAAFVATVMAAIVASALRWRILLRALDLRPGFLHLCAYRAASQSLSAVLPGGRLGGEPLRAWWAIASGVPAPAAITTVVVDRTLEMATGLACVVAFALVLMQRDLPGIGQTVGGALVGVGSLVAALAIGTRRLRSGGLLAPFVRTLGLTRPAIAQHVGVIAESEEAARRLLARPMALAIALGVGLLADLLTLVQYKCLLAAFGLPSSLVAVVGAVFASGAARTLPVPGAVGTVEAAELWMFGLLGYPPEVGVAVGLVIRLRDLAWAAPGFVVLIVRTLRPATSDGAAVARLPDVDRSVAGT